MPRTTRPRAPRLINPSGAAIASIVAFVLTVSASAQRSLDERAYVGLRVRDTARGAEVTWVLPGPIDALARQGAAMRRGDLVLEANGREIKTAAEFAAVIAELAPGESLELHYRPGGADSTVVRTAAVTAASADEWTGTIGRPLRQGAARLEDLPSSYRDALVAEARAVMQFDAEGGVSALLGSLRRLQSSYPDRNQLPLVAAALTDPLALDAIADDVESRTAAIAGADDPLRAALDAAAAVVDMPDWAGAPDALASAERGADETARLRAIGLRFVDLALTDDAAGAARSLAEHLRSTVYLGGAEAGRHIGLIRGAGVRSIDEVLALALASAERGHAWLERVGQDHENAPPSVQVPSWAAGAVSGSVRFITRGPMGRILVVGGPGPNTYDMSRVAWVYDTAGQDRYLYAAPIASDPTPIRVVIDLEGDDTHEPKRGGDVATGVGPAAAFFGASVIDDRAGSDTYAGPSAGGLASGVFGVGILLDRAGDDHYVSQGADSGWSQGAGLYGVGMLIDLDGADEYWGEKLVQGVGGPRSFGALLDAGAGRDLYMAVGRSFPSAYGTPAVSLGMSQGFGFGIRSYAAGGVGALVDLGGSDRYHAGEFAQGGGYFFALGVLADRAGDDVYLGNRYTQGFSAHQAAGALVDSAGDDMYWSMTAAGQGAAWDQSVALLLDRAGDDRYRGDGLSQGSAAQQAVAMLIDLEGVDHYTVSGGYGQGFGGTNTYHYNTDRVFSWSVLADLGDGVDQLSRLSGADAKRISSELHADAPANSRAYGVVINRESIESDR